MKDDLRVLIEMARMYYEENKTQSEIAECFFVSRSLVSKYLSRAKEMGLIEVSINAQLVQPYYELEEQVKRFYDLDDVVCVDPSEGLLVRLGMTAAKYLNRVLQDKSIVAIAPGRTLQSVALNYQSRIQKPEVVFVPLTGGLGSLHTDIQANVVSELLSQKLGAKYVQLHAPVILDTKEAKEILMNQSFIRNVFDLARRADIAVIGIGGEQTFYDMNHIYLHKIDETVLVEERAVGDLCYNFFDEKGVVVDCDWNRRVLSIPIDYLKEIPTVIAVSGGEQKIHGIRAALNSDIINILITDVNTCEYLIETAS